MVSRSSRVLHAALVAVCGAAIVYAPVQAQTSLILQLGQAGHYGPINLGNLAPPPVYGYAPVIVRPAKSSGRWRQASFRPVVLRVPADQVRDWGRYCGRYQACGVPVQFVTDDWYRKVYAPRLRAAQARQTRELRRVSQRDGRVYVLDRLRDGDDD